MRSDFVADDFFMFLAQFERSPALFFDESENFFALGIFEFHNSFKHLFFGEDGHNYLLHSLTAPRPTQRRARRGRSRVRAEQSEEAPQKANRHKNQQPAEDVRRAVTEAHYAQQVLQGLKPLETASSCLMY